MARSVRSSVTMSHVPAHLEPHGQSKNEESLPNSRGCHALAELAAGGVDVRAA